MFLLSLYSEIHDMCYCASSLSLWFVASYLAFSHGMTPVPLVVWLFTCFGYNLPGHQYNFPQELAVWHHMWMCETYAPTNDIQMVAILLEFYLEYTNAHVPCGAVVRDHRITLVAIYLV